jgi:hypothetical protein
MSKTRQPPTETNQTAHLVVLTLKEAKVVSGGTHGTAGPGPASYNVHTTQGSGPASYNLS